MLLSLMTSHGPKRVYTPKSLEFWFERLEADWERFFDAGHVERGHQMYRDSEIREIELGSRDAIIHRKVDKKEEYAVIEWVGEEIRVRSSTTDALLANAIAVAGLHEIEELVADEMTSRLSAASPVPGENGQTATNGHGSGAAASAGTGAAKGENGKDRDLFLSFTATADGLVFHAFWKSGKNRIPALGNTAYHPSPGERAKLIALATYARKAHFRYNQATHAYTLESLADISSFLKDVLPHWKKQFGLEVDAKVDALKLGTRTIEVEAVAERRPGASSDAAGLDLRWIFRAGEKLLTDEQAAALLKHGRTPVLLPDLGIVTMSQEKWDSLNQWRRHLEESEAAGGVLAPYLVFSLFHDQRIKVSVGPEVEAWRQRVLSPPAEPPALPDFLRNYQRRGVSGCTTCAEPAAMACWPTKWGSARPRR
jgi:hypothetical protein